MHYNKVAVRSSETPRKEFLTTGEVARWCGVSAMTVLRWIRQGRLKAHALPGRGDRRIRVEDFVAFLEAHGFPVPPLGASGEKRVLVVDDDPVSVKVVSRILEREGFRMDSAADGFQAGAKLYSFAPDLVTLDLSMPGLGGLQVIEFIRRSPRLAGVKIVVVSGMPESQLRAARKAGADAAFRKPVRPALLLETVRRLLEGGSQRPKGR